MMFASASRRTPINHGDTDAQHRGGKRTSGKIRHDVGIMSIRDQVPRSATTDSWTSWRQTPGGRSVGRRVRISRLERCGS